MDQFIEELVKNEIIFLLGTGIDPSMLDNWAIGYASENGYTEVVQLLLADSRVDPSILDNYAV